MKTEDNKLIAEFMGFPIDNSDDPNNPLYLIGHEYNTEYQATYLIEMKFHNSWDWLMPVARKCIETLMSKDVFKMDHDRVKNINGAASHYASITGYVGSVNMEMSFKCIVDFIKWYNEVKQND